MSFFKPGAFILTLLIFLSVKNHGQDSEIIIPDPGISGVTTVNIADLNNDGLPDIAAFEGGKHPQGRKLFAWYQAPGWTIHEFDRDLEPGPLLGDSEFVDVDNDGDLDVFVGLSFGKKGTCLWLNDGDGKHWTKKMIDPDYGMY